LIALVQRVFEASVVVDSTVVGAIENGLIVLLGVRKGDTDDEAEYLARKTVNLRIFSDENQRMNLSLVDKGYSMLVVSQFTLHADTRYGNRPSFTDAADPKTAERLYRTYIGECSNLIGRVRVQEGKFGAMMKVKLVNDGPVTVILKSKNEG